MISASTSLCDVRSSMNYERGASSESGNEGKDAYTTKEEKMSNLKKSINYFTRPKQLKIQHLFFPI